LPWFWHGSDKHAVMLHIVSGCSNSTTVTEPSINPFKVSYKGNTGHTNRSNRYWRIDIDRKQILCQITDEDSFHTEHDRHV
jgi:hypothetical protein